MSNLPIFDLAGSAMTAQSVRLSTVASNHANADSVAGTPDAVYRAKQPVFSAEPVAGDTSLAGVQVAQVSESTAAPLKRYEPGHPLANERGFVAYAAVDTATEMVSMMSATRAYEANVSAMNTARTLALRALDIGSAS